MLQTKLSTTQYFSDQFRQSFESATLQERVTMLQNYLACISEQSPANDMDREKYNQRCYYFALFLADAIYGSLLSFSAYPEILDPMQNPFLSHWQKITDFDSIDASSLHTVFFDILQKENLALQGDTTTRLIAESIEDEAKKLALSNYKDAALAKLPIPAELALMPQLRPILQKSDWLCRKVTSKNIVAQCKSVNIKKEPRFLRIGIISAVAIIVLTILISIFAPPDRSKFVKNTDGCKIDMALENWESVQEPLSEFCLSIENEFDRDLAGLNITLEFYDGSNDMICSTQLDLTGYMAAKTQKTLTVQLHNDVTESLFMYSPEEIGITAQITGINFNDTIELDPPVDHQTHVLKAARKPDTSKLNMVAQKLDSSLSDFRNADINNSVFEAELNKLGLALDEIWEYIIRSDDLLEKIYQEAASYQDSMQYEKAYVLFGLLETVEYADSASRAYACAIALSGY